MVGRGHEPVQVLQDLRQRHRPLVHLQREGRLGLQRDRRQHPERPQADPGRGEHLGLDGGRAVQDRAVGGHQLQGAHLGGQPAEPRAGAVRAGGQRPRHGLPVDVAEVGQRPALPGEHRVEPVQRHPGLHGHQAVGGQVDEVGVPVQHQLHLLGPANAGERVPAADRPHPATGDRGLVQHRGDLTGGARPPDVDAVGPLVARPVPPPHARGRCPAASGGSSTPVIGRVAPAPRRRPAPGSRGPGRRSRRPGSGRRSGRTSGRG
ncbi:unannotated protein [freshwater metagenome]|uniref:Unannotated protein n=1 Tax=freshwater metagenome TaxID=449393 RepID=A0A6J7HFV0_9ZZZZ